MPTSAKITLGFKELAGPAAELFYSVRENNHADEARPAPKDWFDNFDSFADKAVSRYIDFCDEAERRSSRQ